MIRGTTRLICLDLSKSINITCYNLLHEISFMVRYVK